MMPLQMKSERKREGKQILVCLDSNHTHEHVLRELELYGPLVSKDSYIVVFDTIVEDLPEGYFHRKDPGALEIIPKQQLKSFLRKTTLLLLMNRLITNC